MYSQISVAALVFLKITQDVRTQEFLERGNSPAIYANCTAIADNFR